MNARAAIHAMFPLDEAATTELDQRLNDFGADIIRKGVNAASIIHHACRRSPASCTGCQVRADILDAWSAIADVVEEKATAEEATVTPFFQRGHTYAREHHGRTIEFHVRFVDTAPDCDFPTAFGFRKDPEIDVMLPMDADDFHGCGWTDITDGGETRG